MQLRQQCTCCQSILRCLVVLCLAWPWHVAAGGGGGEYFSSIDSMQYLGMMEKDLIKMYRDYLEVQRQDYVLFRKFIEHAKAQNKLASEGVEDYLGSPINAFTLIKRSVVDWTHLNGWVATNPRRQSLNESMLKLHEDMPLPDYSDLRGAAKGLGRMQKIYNLSASDLAEGDINGIDYESELSLRDCFEIGANLFELKEYRLAIDWLNVTLHILDQEEEDAKESDELSTGKANKNDKDDHCRSAGHNGDNKSCDIEIGEEEYEDEYFWTETGMMSDAVEPPSQEKIAKPELQEPFEGVEYIDTDGTEMGSAEFLQLMAELDYNMFGDDAQKSPANEQISDKTIGKDAEKEPAKSTHETEGLEDEEELSLNKTKGAEKKPKKSTPGTEDLEDEEELPLNKKKEKEEEKKSKKSTSKTEDPKEEEELPFNKKRGAEKKAKKSTPETEDLEDDDEEEEEGEEGEEEKEVPANKKRILIHSLEYMALANYQLGQTDKAIELLDEIWEVDPEYEIQELPQLLRVKNATPQMVLDCLDSLDQYAWFANYTRLCQGIYAPDPSRQKLKCRLDTKQKAVFILAPLKVEELSLDPLITVYHQVLSDAHIENILTLAEEGLVRSGVQNGTESVVRDVRVSQQTWLEYDTPSTASVYRLVKDVTNLDLMNAESMQVANYGIGGQYDPHEDYFGEYYVATRWPGDRIATNLFYLSDVEQGGRTVFTHLNVFSAPAKGSMVTWYNLHKSLTPDARTLHAGCPVIKGTKRIGNVWIHSGYQEFRRPCDLKDDSYKSVGFIR